MRLHRSPRVVGVLGAVFVLVVGVAACGDDGASSGSAGKSDQPVQGGTLVYATDQEVTGWTPPDLRGILSGEDRGQLIYDSLIFLSPQLTYVPNIAQEVTSSDGKTWTMRLRPGVKFSDGTALDAEAVIFNVKLQQDPAGDPGNRTLVIGIDTMRAVDPLTVEFVLKTPNGRFPDAFARLPGQMASPTAYKADPKGFATKPVGAGPFLLDSWVRDSKAVFVRNPNYWNAPRPYLDRIEARILPDPTTRGQALAAGDLDLAVNASPVALAVKGDKSKVTYPLTGFGHMFIAPNQDHAPWSDIRLRQAISMAFDRKLMNDALMFGTLADPVMPCPPYKVEAPQCNPSIYPTYDPTKAKALVKQYTDEGQKLGTYSLVAVAARQDVAEFAQQALREIGIIVTLRILQTPEFTAAVQAGDCDLCMNEITSTTGPENGMNLNFNSTVRHIQKGPNNAELDKAVADQLGGLTPEARTQAGKKAIELLLKDSILAFVSPTLRGSVGKSTVHLGDDLLPGGLVGQNIWKAP